MQILGSTQSIQHEQVVTASRLARLVDRGESFVLWGDHSHKLLEAAQWLAWKFNRLEEAGRLEDVPALGAKVDPLEDFAGGLFELEALA
jgi:hypothetical protein